MALPSLRPVCAADFNEKVVASDRSVAVACTCIAYFARAGAICIRYLMALASWQSTLLAGCHADMWWLRVWFAAMVGVA